MAQGKPTVLRQEIQSFILPVSRAFTQRDQQEPIFFQFYPNIEGGLTDTANYDDVGGDIIGRGEPFSIYKNGGPKTFTITTKFAAIDDLYDEYWLQRQVHRLRALTYPIYDRDDLFETGTGKFFAPPLAIFTMGARFINVPVVINSITVTDMDGTIITDGDGLPQVVDVSISMKTNYPYGFVPGYINMINLFPDNPSNRIEPTNLSFGGTISVPADVRDVLIDAALPPKRTWLTTRGQRGLIDGRL